MGHTRICDARKRYAWQLIQRKVRYADIRDRITKRFGTQHGPISNGALTDIKAAATLTGDPCFASPLIRSGKTLTYAQKRTILDALLEECTTTTAELSARLRAVETSARTRFCHSTIDDAIRAAYFTLKRVTVYNARRDPFESAQARRAIGCYDVRCVLVLDASHIASDEAQRRQGRAPRGARALCSAYPCSGNQLLSVLGAMSIDGMEMAACDVVEGSIDFDRYFQWVVEKLGPVLNPYDDRRLPNSVIVMDNVNIQHQPRLLNYFRSKGVKVCFLARYDPRCSPIEQAFAQMKSFLRYKVSAALFAARPHACLRAALASISQENARGYFRAAGHMRALDAAVATRRRKARLLRLLLLAL